MGPLSIRIPIYRGQIPPRGAPLSKLSLKIWIFRFGRVNPLLAAATPELIPTVLTSSRCAKYFFGQFSKVYESARQTRELILANRWESMSASIPDLAGSLSFHRFCFKKENRFWLSPQPSFCTTVVISFLRGALWTRQVLNCDKTSPKKVTVLLRSHPSIRIYTRASFSAT